MSFNNKTLIALTFIAITLIVTTFALVSARETAGQDPTQTTIPSSQSVSTPLPSGPVQVVRFTVYDAGIYPHEARVNAGRVVVSLVDYSGGTDGLIIERENGTARVPAGTGRRQGQHWRGRAELSLEAGRYRIRDASRPENSATLMVEQ